MLTNIFIALVIALPIAEKAQGHKMGTLVIGGKPAGAGQFPYQLSIQDKRGHFCGASLIEAPTQKYLMAVTAAHCFFDYDNELIPFEPLTLGGGSISVHNLEQVIKVKKVVIHEGFNSGETFENDIAVLFLEKPFTLGPNVKPIQLYNDKIASEYKYKKLVVSGWGTTQENVAKYPDALQYVEVPLVPLPKCRKQYAELYGTEEIVFDSDICAGYENGGRDACQGDSGGPGVAQFDGGVRFLVGIVSFGEGCAQAKFPGVYSSVRSYYNWIDEQATKYERT